MAFYRLTRYGGGLSSEFDAADDATAVIEAQVLVHRFLAATQGPSEPTGFEVQRRDGEGWLTYSLFTRR